MTNIDVRELEEWLVSKGIEFNGSGDPLLEDQDGDVFKLSAGTNLIKISVTSKDGDDLNESAFYINDLDTIVGMMYYVQLREEGHEV